MTNPNCSKIRVFAEFPWPAAKYFLERIAELVRRWEQNVGEKERSGKGKDLIALYSVGLFLFSAQIIFEGNKNWTTNTQKNRTKMKKIMFPRPEREDQRIEKERKSYLHINSDASWNGPVHNHIQIVIFGDFWLFFLYIVWRADNRTDEPELEKRHGRL